jgi:hypothetical protein
MEIIYEVVVSLELCSTNEWKFLKVYVEPYMHNVILVCVQLEIRNVIIIHCTATTCIHRLELCRCSYLNEFRFRIVIKPWSKPPPDVVI